MSRTRMFREMGLCEPEILLPTQVAVSSGTEHRPALELVAAMLEDALRCVLRNVDARRGPKRRQFVEACNWFLDDRREWPFAFVNVCELLGIDAAAVRQTLRPFLAIPDGRQVSEARLAEPIESCRAGGVHD